MQEKQVDSLDVFEDIIEVLDLLSKVKSLEEIKTILKEKSLDAQIRQNIKKIVEFHINEAEKQIAIIEKHATMKKARDVLKKLKT